MRLPIGTVLDRLAAEGHATTEQAALARAALAAAADAEDATPWYVRVAAGFGAWTATLLVIAFLGGIGLRPNEPAALVVGLALVVGAVALRRAARAEFPRQLALAASFAGQALVVLRMADVTDSFGGAGLAALALSLALIPLVPDAAHRFLSAIAGALGLVAAVVSLRLRWDGDPLAPSLLVVRGADLAALALVAVAAWGWRGGARWRDRHVADVVEPVTWGVTVALLGFLLADAMLGPTHGWLTPGHQPSDWQLGWLTTAGLTAALAALALAVGREQGGATDAGWLAAVGGIVALGLLTLPTPGIVAAMSVVLLGFDRRRPLLVGLGALFLVAFLGVFYHGLRLTLLEKSGMLAASGLLLLAACWWLRPRPSGASAEGGA